MSGAVTPPDAVGPDGAGAGAGAPDPGSTGVTPTTTPTTTGLVTTAPSTTVPSTTAPSTTARCATAEDTRTLAAAVAQLLRAGDLLVLSGELGAGKTTFTQGLAEALGVRGPITSPTFVIARVHPSLVGGPALVHVDAYRLGGPDELDDLDLDASLADSVTVVEWGEGVAEQLSADRLHLELHRPAQEGEGEVREVRLTPVGDRWRDVLLPGA